MPDGSTLWVDVSGSCTQSSLKHFLTTRSLTSMDNGHLSKFLACRYIDAALSFMSICALERMFNESKIESLKTFSGDYASGSLDHVRIIISLR